jgi:hypothetical protein
MGPEKQLLEAWKRGEPLGHAWLRLADKENKRRYHEARRKGFHSSIQISLEMDLMARLEEGELQAIGIEGGNNPSLVLIPQFFFSKTAKIDLDAGTVTDLGKKFHQVRVIEGPREAEDVPSTGPGPIQIIDPKLIRGDWETAAESVPSEDEPANKAPIQAEQELVGETLSSEPEPPNGRLIPSERKPTEEATANEQASSNKRGMGRPPLVPKVCEVIRELIGRGEFAGLDKWEIERLIRRKARERFPTWFPKPDRPTKNTINKALRLEGGHLRLRNKVHKVQKVHKD